MILFVDTTEKSARVGIWNDSDLRVEKFEAGRELDSLILVKIDELLSKYQINLKDIEGIIASVGPGSFTGLRIGLSVVNALGYGLNIPVAGVANEKNEQAIIKTGLKELDGKTKFEKPVLAEYGAEPNITKPKDN
jgi:tRNA threonylcarbamoyl adenosine modification protein YeaZ